MQANKGEEQSCVAGNWSGLERQQGQCMIAIIDDTVGHAYGCAVILDAAVLLVAFTSSQVATWYIPT